jgi:hypothetical protein
MPPDVKVIFTISNRSFLDDVNREVSRQKFYATLPSKLDNAEEEWHESQPPSVPPPIELGDLHIRAPWDQSSTG